MKIRFAIDDLGETRLSCYSNCTSWFVHLIPFSRFQYVEIIFLNLSDTFLCAQCVFVSTNLLILMSYLWIDWNKISSVCASDDISKPSIINNTILVVSFVLDYSKFP